MTTLSAATEALIADITVKLPRQHTPEFDRIGQGMTYVQVCTSLDDADATERVNELGPMPHRPDRRWQLATDGELAPVACDEKPTHRHIVFEC